MTNGVTSLVQHMEGALEAANMAWWEIELPSGALTFSHFKAKTLGYDAKDFVHYTHFTDLIHPDDLEATMQAMRDHYSGSVPYYDTTYRIKAADGTYRVFHDKGRVVEQSKDNTIVAGIVIDITDEK